MRRRIRSRVPKSNTSARLTVIVGLIVALVCVLLFRKNVAQSVANFFSAFNPPTEDLNIGGNGASAPKKESKKREE